MRNKIGLLVEYYLFLGVVAVVVKCQSPQQSQSSSTADDAQPAKDFIGSTEDQFCYFQPKRPFYQRLSDGAVCCRGKQVPYITVTPETTGPCAISTKTDSDGILNAQSLWCAYSCTLKKMGLIDNTDRVVPDKFFTHLSAGLKASSKLKLKLIMQNYLGCYKSLKNSKFNCYSALGFKKCYMDAMEYLCSIGMPEKNDFSLLKKPTIDYENFKPFCYYNGRRAMPGCCHGKPLPWTITEIMEAPRNATKQQICIDKMGNECDGTCFLNSADVVNDAMELDVTKFSKTVLQQFPTVLPSSWMYFTGPTFLFYDELLVDVAGDQDEDSSTRICQFHDQVLELHETKVEQYCSMTAEEVTVLVKSNAQESKKGK